VDAWETRSLNHALACVKGRRHERSNVIAIKLRYVYALSNNASTLWRKVIACYSYRSGPVYIVIATLSVQSWFT
jgi:hypothetical protein